MAQFVGAAMTAASSFHHEALLYDGEAEFVGRCAAFADEGLERGEPVLVMVGAKKLELLRSVLGQRAEGVEFADMEVVGRNPARVIPAWARFVSDHVSEGGARMLRGIGEPVWRGRNPDEMAECQLHESLINLAFADADRFRLICPYDTSSLSDEVIAEARRSHPIVSDGDGAGRSGDYCGVDTAGFAEPLPAPPSEADQYTVTLDGLRDARRIVHRRATEAGLGERAEDLVLAVNEILSNSLHHAHEDGLLRIWSEPDGLVCEVCDSGHIHQPLIGREEPAVGQIGGHGVWVVNLVCDLVQVRSSEEGSTVRMKMSPA